MGLNKCVWKKLSGEFCNQACVGKYCALHNQRISKGAPGVIDCLVCQRRVKGRTPLCARCGGHQFRELARYHKRKNNIVLTVEQYIKKEKQFRE